MTCTVLTLTEPFEMNQAIQVLYLLYDVVVQVKLHEVREKP